MSARTEKAHQALADACAEFENVDDTSAMERVRFLLDVADIQAQIAQAEALERTARHPANWPHTPPPNQVTPFKPWVGPQYADGSVRSYDQVPWAERSGLDHSTPRAPYTRDVS